MYFIKFLFKWWNRSPFLDYLICEQCKSEYLIIVEHQHFIHSTVELFVSGWEAVWRLHITFFNIHWIQIILSCQFTIVTDSSEWNSNSLHSLGCYRMDKIQKIKIQCLNNFLWRVWSRNLSPLLPAINQSRLFWMSVLSMLHGMSWRMNLLIGYKFNWIFLPCKRIAKNLRPNWGHLEQICSETIPNNICCT